MLKLLIDVLIIACVINIVLAVVAYIWWKYSKTDFKHKKPNWPYIIKFESSLLGAAVVFGLFDSFTFTGAINLLLMVNRGLVTINKALFVAFSFPEMILSGIANEIIKLETFLTNIVQHINL